jgi:hypothetical protein
MLRGTQAARLTRAACCSAVERQHSQREACMLKTDWAKLYAIMDKRIELKYEQLPAGEQIGQRIGSGKQSRASLGPEPATPSFVPRSRKPTR